MIQKGTDDLLKELSQPDISMTDYIDDNPDAFIEIDLKKFWHALIAKTGMTKSDIINKSDFGYVYFYDVINGKKTPSRDKIIRLMLAAHLSLDDCQRALNFCGRSQLYPRVKRDSILIYGLSHNLSIYDVSDLLTLQGEADLK